jgi:gamma-glutamyl-gamma-aminobutyrate hydrolase PuuD
MHPTTSSVHIAIYGPEEIAPVGKGVGLWPAGYAGALTAAGAVAEFLDSAEDDASWDELLGGIHGVVFPGWKNGSSPNPFAEEGLCHWCRDHRVPLLAIDDGMLALNSAFGGTSYLDLPREVPEALQHRHRPEHGIRHAIAVERGTIMASLYGEGEIVVNSEHRQAIHRLANGFQVSARALDDVIEAIEWKAPTWHCLAVQWQPASATASGLDIQLFRGLVDVCARRSGKGGRRRVAISA